MKSSRRNFLFSAVTGPIAASVGAAGKGGMNAIAGLLPAAPMDFENPQLIRYDAKCFTINNKDTLIMSAAFHYPRCPRALWPDRLQKLKLAGFNTIETYVFWNYHEPVEGKVDLAEFEAFVKLVHTMGFMMIARPGPYVCAEWERGGFPSWIAAKRFPLRTNDPQSIQTSKHWFDAVLPVIMKNQIMLGGPIIMVQVENEYDFSPPMPDTAKREYISALAHMVWNAGITIPVITCWTSQARENSDPDMARIMDTCNFYPRWNIAAEVPPALAKLRNEEPASPLAISELQGGWFSTIGGVLSVEQAGVNAEQISTLTKTALEQGVTSFNYYMGYGGTNFDWAAKKLTTTYDYAAPVREPGGLWDKYYAVRGIGLALRAFGDVLTRAVLLPGAQSTNPNVSVAQRTNGVSTVLFVRENANAPQRYTMTFTDPHSPSKRIINAPRKTQLQLGPREMKMLPVQIQISGGRLCYATGELLAHGVNLDRDFMILHDLPGRTLEMAFATEEEPIIDGNPDYRYLDSEYETSVLGMLVGPTEKMFLYQNHLQVFIVPSAKALRTFLWEFPPTIVPGSEEKKAVIAPIFTDAYSLGASGASKNRAWVELDLKPGQHDVAIMLPPLPMKLRIDGELTDFQYDRSWHLARVHLTTPAVDETTSDLTEGKSWVETFDPSVGEWITGPLHALEDLGSVPYGYVKYRATFTFNGEAKMFISARADDAKKVFLNGKFVVEASNTEKLTDFALSKYAQSGSNLVEIAYEAFGAPNGGETLGELKGLESVGVGSTLATARGIDTWQIQLRSVLMQGRELHGPSASPPTGSPKHQHHEKERHSAKTMAAPLADSSASTNDSLRLHGSDWNSSPAYTNFNASHAQSSSADEVQLSPGGWSAKDELRAGESTEEHNVVRGSVLGGSAWIPARLASISAPDGGLNLVPAFTWVKAGPLRLPAQGGENTPLKLTMDSDRDALIFLGARFIGRYSTAGPQKYFYLPEPYLNSDGGDTITIALAYANDSKHFQRLQVSIYPEFSTRRTKLEFEW